MIYEKLTKEIISAFYEVHNTLGFGFLEQVYQNALYKELLRRGLFCQSQKRDGSLL
ncbi:GxxExxY protein [Bacteroides faecis]|uniref:GxxExxY protein n=1 Tax=Bacteroides faecis TaxID=674529 RepID=UPI00286DCD06|nr:GxxExxY protein [Bacteroides faecis]MCS2234047.1 GxxExxY protein [Bacteroides faecis]